MTTTATRRAGTTVPVAVRWAPLALAALAGAALIAALVLGGGGYQPSPEGLPDPGPLVGWGLPIVKLVVDAAGILTVGFAVAATFLDPQGRKGSLSKVGRADVVRTAVAAAVWCVSSLLLLVLTLADILGITLSEAMNPSIVMTYAPELPQTQAYALVALLAGVIAVGGWLTTTVDVAAAWVLLALVGMAAPVLSGHAAGLGDHALATSAGVAHVVAVSVWVGGLLALTVHAWRRDAGLAAATRAFSTVALVCVAVLAASGAANAYVRLASPSELLTTGYGLLVLAKVAVLAALVLLAARIRARLLPGLDGAEARRTFAKVALLEAGLMAVAVGISVGLSRTPPPRQTIELQSLGETLLGYPYPAAPTWQRVVFGFQLDALFLVGSLVLAALYVMGVMRLRARGDRWPWGRTVSWLLGIGCLIWATNAGIATYSPAAFSMHMLQHMWLSMMAPILLVLGAPTTLALRAIKPAPAGRRGPREWIVWSLHTPVARFVTHPVYVLIVFTVGLYGLYYTSIFASAMSTHAGHLLMNVHFVLAGYLFYWVVIGVDPTPRQVPYWGRLLLVLLSLVIHSFFALPMMMATAPFAADWYGVVRPPWMTDPVADTQLGGGIAWAFGEIPSLVVLVALSVQWARSDEREARRNDRKADRDGDVELVAYNARLAALAARDAADAAEEASRDARR